MATALDFNRLSPRNASGIDPLDHRVLVQHDKVEEKIGSIILPDQERAKLKFAMTKATVVAVGQMAWAEARYDAERMGIVFTAPIPGDRVQVGKYTGDQIKGADGKEYTLMNDTDVIGRLIGE